MNASTWASTAPRENMVGSESDRLMMLPFLFTQVAQLRAQNEELFAQNVLLWQQVAELSSHVQSLELRMELRIMTLQHDSTAATQALQPIAGPQQEGEPGESPPLVDLSEEKPEKRKRTKKAKATTTSPRIEFASPALRLDLVQQEAEATEYVQQAGVRSRLDTLPHMLEVYKAEADATTRRHLRIFFVKQHFASLEEEQLADLTQPYLAFRTQLEDLLTQYQVSEPEWPEFAVQQLRSQLLKAAVDHLRARATPPSNGCVLL
jgi:hypothetical protein